MNIDRTFTWRTSDGCHIAPRDMETRHIVNTLRMIWNHLCPPERRIPGGRSYVVESITGRGADYLRTAVRALLSEAESRQDLGPLR
jgi:hypothetical protein